MGFSETLNLFLRAYKESVNPVTYQVLCFSITMNCVYNIGEGGELDCKQLYNGLFVYSDPLPRSEPWSFIKNRRPNVECTFSNRLKSGTNLSSFLFFFLWRSQKAVMYVQKLQNFLLKNIVSVICYTWITLSWGFAVSDCNMEGFTSDFSTYAFVYESLFYQYQKFHLLTLDSPSQQQNPRKISWLFHHVAN